MNNFLTRSIAFVFAMMLLFSAGAVVANEAKAESDLSLESKSALLMEFESGDVLFEKEVVM